MPHPVPSPDTSLSTSDSYIRKDATETAYGRIERVVTFRSIGSTDSRAAPNSSKSNPLYRAVLAWLQEREAVQTFFRLRLANVRKATLPGDTVRILHRVVGDDGLLLSVDDDFTIR